MSYWSQEKDILGVNNFGDLVPEVVWLGPDYEEKLLELIDIRIHYKINKYQGKKPDESVKQRILDLKTALRSQLEQELVQRLEAIRRYLRNPEKDPHLSLEEILREKRHRAKPLIDPLMRVIRKRRLWVGRKKTEHEPHQGPRV
jgi:hypothetical protein